MTPVLKDQCQLARELLALTRELVDLARAGDWAALAVRERTRKELAQELFARPVEPAAAPVVAECVRQVLTADQELLELVGAGRDEAAQAIQDARAGKQATDAYRRFSR